VIRPYLRYFFLATFFLATAFLAAGFFFAVVLHLPLQQQAIVILLG